jgi:CubicO group peptidase (beta-lactamase class C family)
MNVRLARWFGLIGGGLMALAPLLVAALPAAAEIAEAPPAANPSEKADALLAGLIKTNDPGLAVLVAQDGKILFEKGYGLADREQQVPVIPQTTFRIGSITKQFTASAILKLQEEGKLSVDDKLSKYIPNFPRGDEVTLRLLLTHTSGIHSYTDEPDFIGRVTNASTTGAIIEEMKQYPYDFDPGAKWRYDNSGYLLLGYIVEKVSGQGYGDYLHGNFFEPLGMTNTGAYRTHLGLPHEALGYNLATNGFQPALNWDMSWAGGAGVLYSTVEDLYRWNEGIFNGRVLDAASLKAAFTPVKMTENLTRDPDSGYGFGWIVTRHRGLREILHNGGLNGFSSSLLRLPDEKFTVVILANAQPGRPDASPNQLAYKLVDIYLAAKLAPLPTVNTNVSPESYVALTGRYELWGGIITISRRGTHLFGQLNSQPKREIYPESDTEFFAKEVDAQITFVKDSGGKAVKLILHQGGLDLDATRVKEIAEAKVDPAIYDSLAGKYDYGNGAVLTVTREGNQLFAQLTGQSKFEIFPASETNYFWKVADAQVTFVKDAGGKVTKAIHHQNGQTIDAPKIQ